MRLKVPCQAIDFNANDIYGEPLQLRDYRGKRVILSFFRDAACPFCNFRVYELTQNYKEWKKLGIEVIAVFSSPADEVRKFVAQHPRPFRLISDPDLVLYNHYGVEHSVSALFKALFFNLPRIVRGVMKGGRPANNPNVKIVPADFLLEIDGRVKDLWYGRDTADHIPMQRVHSFVEGMKKINQRRQTKARDLKRSKAAGKTDLGNKGAALSAG